MQSSPSYEKTSDDPIDADVVFYVSGHNLDLETLQGLNDRILDALTEAYPTKQVEDFEIQRRAATIVFVGTGLSVDIVPVVADPDHPGYGWQFDLQDGTRLRTCAPCAIKFVRDRKEVDPDYRTLVRMAKRWRNHAELKHLKSFLIELIMAHVLAIYGRSGSLEARLRQFLLYIAQSGLKERIVFPETIDPIPAFADPVVIVDPVCASNNVASRLSEAERREIVEAAQAAWEAAHFASAEDDLELWERGVRPPLQGRGAGMSTSLSRTRVESYTSTDIANAVRRMEADMVMMAQSTGALTETKARDYAYDCEALAQAGYLSKVDLTLLTGGAYGVEVAATTYSVNSEAAGLATSRPGGVLWPRVCEPASADRSLLYRLLRPDSAEPDEATVKD